MVASRPVLVDESTRIENHLGSVLRLQELQIGDYVSVSGSIDGSGRLKARMVEKGDDEVCRNDAGIVVFENLKVPDGTECVLNGTIIEGNVFVYRGATLIASGIRTEGNIQAEGAMSVIIDGESHVGGNIQVKQGFAASIRATTIEGDVQLESNGGPVDAELNVVGGNLQVFQNEGGVTLNGNRIAENLQCKENTPRPSGAGNVAGDKEDQCAGM
jgi:hypothetical protein